MSGLSVTVAHANFASTDNIKSLESGRTCFIFGAYALNVYATRWLSEHLNTESDDARRETRAACENQLISSHQDAEHFKTMSYTELRKTVTDAGRGTRKIEKDRKQ